MTKTTPTTPAAAAKAAYAEGKKFAEEHGTGLAREKCPYKASVPKTLLALQELAWMKGAYAEEFTAPDWAAKAE